MVPDLLVQEGSQGLEKTWDLPKVTQLFSVKAGVGLHVWAFCQEPVGDISWYPLNRQAPEVGMDEAGFPFF